MQQTITGDHIILTDPPIVDRSPELARASHSGGIGSLTGRWVKMNQEDIDEGERGVGATCALARMLIREGFTDVNIEGEHPTVNGRPIEIGAEIVDWIGRFDRREHVEPILIVLSD
jgi:hypothetical protein